MNHAIYGTMTVAVSVTPASGGFVIVGHNGPPNGQVHDAIVSGTQRRNGLGAALSRARREFAKMRRRRERIARAERSRARAIAELHGNLHAYLMVERLADGERF
jgi:hypothetical protein